MPSFPAHCDACGYTFFSGIEASQATALMLANNRHQCPKCGAWAKVVEGTFDVSGGEFRQTGGSSVDAEKFSRLGLILVQAKLDRLKPHEIVEKVAPHSAALAQRLRNVMDDPVAFATVLAALITCFGAIATAVVLTSGSDPGPSVMNVQIHREATEGELENYRDSLHEFRKRGFKPPKWLADYIEPEKD